MHDHAQISNTSGTSKSQRYKKLSVKTKSLDKLLGFLKQKQHRDIIGVDTRKAGIRLCGDVVEFCKANGLAVVGSQIYF